MFEHSAALMYGVKKRNKAIGHHFFDRDTMRFFNGRLGPAEQIDDDGSVVFIHSIQGPYEHSPRQYKVALAKPDGWIEDITPGDGFETLALAEKHVHAMRQ